MKLDESKVTKAVDEFCKNEFWKEYYENAPTKECKRYIALGFYYSEYLEYDSIKEERLGLKNSMTLSDYQHLYTYVGNNPLATFYRKKIIELGGEDPRK